MIEPLVIQQLVRVGQIGDANDERAALLLADLRPHDEINRLHWSEWDAIAGRMPTEALVSLVKGLTLAEVANRWIGGSVSSVIWTFRHVQRRDSQLADGLADWILPRTRNPYAPYGSDSLGAASAAQYRVLKDARSKRIDAGVEEVRRHEECSATERRLRAEQRARSAADRHSAARAALIDKLNVLPVIEQLDMLAGDERYSVEFYPACVAGRAKQADLAALPVGLRLALLRKLRGKKKGPWRRLKAALLDTFRRRGDVHDHSTPWDRGPWF